MYQVNFKLRSIDNEMLATLLAAYTHWREESPLLVDLEGILTDEMNRRQANAPPSDYFAIELESLSTRSLLFAMILLTLCRNLVNGLGRVDAAVFCEVVRMAIEEEITTRTVPAGPEELEGMEATELTSLFKKDQEEEEQWKYRN